ncbi:hypothetical protein [Listeria ilorinensis]|uniref:hypothetical protein n=1 Tax=Listeria ilorinensis TaxID=2867439 RepID=UPI001EF598A5|nr:hypothetical protein [Listeria ilorinensis]
MIHSLTIQNINTGGTKVFSNVWTVMLNTAQGTSSIQSLPQSPKWLEADLLSFTIILENGKLETFPAPTWIILHVDR